jgi:hypothetical protein
MSSCHGHGTSPTGTPTTLLRLITAGSKPDCGQCAVSIRSGRHQRSRPGTRSSRTCAAGTTSCPPNTQPAIVSMLASRPRTLPLTIWPRNGHPGQSSTPDRHRQRNSPTSCPSTFPPVIEYASRLKSLLLICSSARKPRGSAVPDQLTQQRRPDRSSTSATSANPTSRFSMIRSLSHRSVGELVGYEKPMRIPDRHRPVCGGAAGSCTVTRSPPAARGVTVRVPSCVWVMLLTIARPRPTPAWSVCMRSVPR